ASNSNDAQLALELQKWSEVAAAITDTSVPLDNSTRNAINDQVAKLPSSAVIERGRASGIADFGDSHLNWASELGRGFDSISRNTNLITGLSIADAAEQGQFELVTQLLRNKPSSID